MNHPPELSPEAEEAVKGAVREIASPQAVSWESIFAAVCIIVYLITRPVPTSSRIPFSVQLSVPTTVTGFVLLAFAAVCGWSAVRKRRHHGRITGGACLVVSAYLLLDWLHFLLNWWQRLWG
jgi:hypothetical protein